jgi:hypothetical protein
MIVMLILNIFFYTLLYFNTLRENPVDKSTLKPPVKIPVLLSANFGELRLDHFHSGIDIKTQGVTGKEVVASADGYIYRIGVSPGGFGKALYVRHPSGFSTVYAHLDRFTPAIDEYVKNLQYENKSFLVTLFPAKELFPVKQGQLIAYSGNSGSSGGPHLHFEVRKSDNEVPVNPLLFDMGISDNLLPVIEKLAVYPAATNTYINNRKSPLKINARGSNGRYSIAEENEIVISGKAGFGLKVHDLLNGSYNRCAAYSIVVKVDSLTVFNFVMDEFSFNESRYVNSHIDYETFIRENSYLERAYILPNDKLGTYKQSVNRGIFNFNDSGIHNILITVSDVNNNKSKLAFRVRSKPEKPAEFESLPDSDPKMMPYNKANRYSAENVSVNIPSDALYDTLYFSFKKNPGTPVMLSDLYSIHDKYTPLQKAYTLAIKPSFIPEGKESKMLIVQLNDNISKKPYASKWSEGFLKADVFSFGNFYVGIDTVSPTISSALFNPGANLTGRREAKIKITDDFSGIKSYEPTIDGKWALFEYDPKTEALIYRFDEKRIAKGTKHNLSLKVTDNVNNTSYYSCDFTW